MKTKMKHLITSLSLVGLLCLIGCSKSEISSPSGNDEPELPIITRGLEGNEYYFYGLENKKIYLSLDTKPVSLSAEGTKMPNKRGAPSFIDDYGKEVRLSNFFYVKLKKESDIDLLEQMAEQTGCIIRRQDKFMPLWYILCVGETAELNALECANFFHESGLFSSAEPDFIVDITLSNDEYFSLQWNLKNTGQFGTAGIDIKAEQAWAISTGHNVIVAVIDDGVNMTHPDLTANMYSLSYDAQTGTSPQQVRGYHGTPVAGIIGATRNNGIGIAGIAPDSRIMSISRLLPAADAVTDWDAFKRQIADGINWAWQQGADVINCSWGHKDFEGPYITEALNNALTQGRNGKGCVVVCGSGNNETSPPVGAPIIYPANSDSRILTVGEISEFGYRASTSCFGNTLDVMAPGAVYTTRGTTDYYNRNSPFGGTSAAAPHVSGVAALILSVDPDLTRKEVVDIIERTAQKITYNGRYIYRPNVSGRPNGTWNEEMGYGLVDARAAVIQASFVPFPLSAPVISASVFPTWQGEYAVVSVNNAEAGVSYEWEVNGLILDGKTGPTITLDGTPGAEIIYPLASSRPVRFTVKCRAHDDQTQTTSGWSNTVSVTVQFHNS